MADFKDELSPAVVAALADELLRAWPELPHAALIAEATDGLEQLELKARAALIEAALVRALPADVPTLAGIVDRALAAEAFAGWMLWPFLDAVTRIGIDAPEQTLDLLRLLTPRWTAEGAIRPLIARHPDVAFARLARWVADPDEHVRRLVSEGTRPRLPWSARLRALVDDPMPSIALLDRLHDDPSEYVRRSVANHLNDIAKDHPELAIATAARWQAAGGRHVDRVVRHSLRGLIKAGDQRALALVGIDVGATIDVLAFAVDPPTLAIGGSATVSCTLRSTAGAPVVAEVDLRVRYPDARGELTRAKTFKLARPRLEPDVATPIERRFAFRSVSIRALHPGEHRLALQVNGRVVAELPLALVPAG